MPQSAKQFAADLAKGGVAQTTIDELVKAQITSGHLIDDLPKGAEPPASFGLKELRAGMDGLRTQLEKGETFYYAPENDDEGVDGDDLAKSLGGLLRQTKAAADEAATIAATSGEALAKGMLAQGLVIEALGVQAVATQSQLGHVAACLDTIMKGFNIAAPPKSDVSQIKPAPAPGEQAAAAAADSSLSKGRTREQVVEAMMTELQKAADRGDMNKAHALQGAITSLEGGGNLDDAIRDSGMTF